MTDMPANAQGSEELPDLFPGFESRVIKTSEADIFARIGGDGPPLLFLHGYPQTHVMWHNLIPVFSLHYQCIVPDLRGYGASRLRNESEDIAAYSKRAMGQDFFELMSALGHEKFSILGHDRGARVAYRMALDEGARIERLALLDIMPTYDYLDKMDKDYAMKIYHWAFLAQPFPLPEHLIASDPEFYCQYTLASWTQAKDLSAFDEGALAHYSAAALDEEHIFAMCQDYRAGATLDYEHDKTDLDMGKKITCPMLALWGEGGMKSKSTSPIETWQTLAENVTGQGIQSGHFLAEENPQETIEALLPFFLLN